MSNPSYRRNKCHHCIHLDESKGGGGQSAAASRTRESVLLAQRSASIAELPTLSTCWRAVCDIARSASCRRSVTPICSRRRNHVTRLDKEIP